MRKDARWHYGKGVIIGENGWFDLWGLPWPFFCQFFANFPTEIATDSTLK